MAHDVESKSLSTVPIRRQVSPQTKPSLVISFGDGQEAIMSRLYRLLTGFQDMLPVGEKVEFYYGDCSVMKHGLGRWHGAGEEAGVILSGLWERNQLKEKRKVAVPGGGKDWLELQKSPPLSPIVSPRSGSTIVLSRPVRPVLYVYCPLFDLCLCVC